MLIMTIAVDFDGTIVEHKYPFIGKELPHCRRVLYDLIEKGHNIILFTMRGGKELDEAVSVITHGMSIPLYGINVNPHQMEWTNSPKAHADIYIDDAALGAPLVYPMEGEPFINWLKVEELLKNRNIL
jgi:hypothetical protein